MPYKKKSGICLTDKVKAFYFYQTLLVHLAKKGKRTDVEERRLKIKVFLDKTYEVPFYSNKIIQTLNEGNTRTQKHEQIHGIDTWTYLRTWATSKTALRHIFKNTLKTRKPVNKYVFV